MNKSPLPALNEPKTNGIYVDRQPPKGGSKMQSVQNLNNNRQ